MTKRRHAVLDYGTTMLATGLIQLVGIVAGIMVARFLGPAGRGDMATVFWLPLLMSAAGIIGLPQAVAFEVSRNRESDNRMTASGFWLALILGLIEMAILYPFIPYILGADKVHLISISRWFLLSLPLTFANMTLLGIDQGRQTFGRYNLLRLLPPVLYGAGMILLWFLGKVGVAEFVFANLCAQIVTLAIRAAVAGRALLPSSIASWVKSDRIVLRQGVVFHLPALAGILFMQADMFLLIRLVSPEQIGYYAIAMAIALGQMGITTSLVMVNFPRVAGQTPERAGETLLRQFRMAQPIVIGTAALVAIFCYWIVRYLFGTAFLPSVSSAYVLITALALWGLSQIVDSGLRAAGHAMAGFKASSVGLIALLAIGAILTRQSGIVGMAVAVLLVQILVLSLLIYFLHNLLNVAWGDLWGFNKSSIRAVVARLRIK